MEFVLFLFLEEKKRKTYYTTFFSKKPVVYFLDLPSGKTQKVSKIS